MDQHLIIDCSTGETTTVPLTPEELAQREADAATAQASEQARQDAEAQKSSALQRLKDHAEADPRFADVLIALGLPVSS
jgi:hypothetical protein